MDYIKLELESRRTWKLFKDQCEVDVEGRQQINIQSEAASL